MTDDSPLDNPIWHALHSRQQSLNHRTGLAARYPAEVSRFAAVERPTATAFNDLATLVQPGETVAFFTAEPLETPDGWDVLHSRALDQMVCDHLDDSTSKVTLQLGTQDVPEMLALALATKRARSPKARSAWVAISVFDPRTGALPRWQASV